MGHCVFRFGTIAVILLAAGCRTEQGTGLLYLSISADDAIPSEAASRIDIGYPGGRGHSWQGMFPPKARSTLPLKLQVPNLPANNAPVTFTVQAFDAAGCAVTKAATVSATIKAGAETDPLSITLTNSDTSCADSGIFGNVIDGGVAAFDGAMPVTDGAGTLGSETGVALADVAPFDTPAIADLTDLILPDASGRPDGVYFADAPPLSDTASDIALGAGGAPGTGGTMGSGGTKGTGGTVGTGATSGTGGTTSTGGLISSGGATGAGGMTSPGGSTSTSGSPGTGGVIGTSGVAGTSDTGGVNGLGGVSGGDGGPGSGGTPGSGGDATDGSAANCSATMPSGGTTRTGTSVNGTADGLNYGIWSNGNAGSITVFPNAHAFSASWNNSSDFLAHLGSDFAATKSYTAYGTITANYVEVKSGTGGGFSSIGMYGWMQSPCVEWYINEDSYSPWSTRGSITATIDGATYYLTVATVTGTGGNDCEAGHTGGWTQVISTRQTPRHCGTITVSDHFTAWANQGWILGN
jgi:endo-1,4-beta-xylanase